MNENIVMSRSRFHRISNVQWTYRWFSIGWCLSWESNTNSVMLLQMKSFPCGIGRNQRVFLCIGWRMKICFWSLVKLLLCGEKFDVIIFIIFITVIIIATKRWLILWCGFKASVNLSPNRMSLSVPCRSCRPAANRIKWLLTCSSLISLTWPMVEEEKTPEAILLFV